MEAGNPENPGDAKLEPSGLLNENDAADVASGFPSPKAGVEEELEQFQSQRFTLGKIPLKPPPVELLTV